VVVGKVRSAVGALADRQRAAVELHQFEDYTYAEVAAALATSPKAAKSLLYRARNRLRVSLGPFAEGRETKGPTLAFCGDDPGRGPVDQRGARGGAARRS
jgi:hypothetical protein